MLAIEQRAQKMLDPSTEDPFYRALLERDERYDGIVFFGVTSTGIVCRASCPARKPKPENTRLFIDLEAALRAGFRPCKRCRPEGASPEDESIKKVITACRAIADDLDARPDWDEVTNRLGISERRLRDLFQGALGVSPGQFASALRHARLKDALQDGERVTDAVYTAGYGSPSRVYESAGKRLGMTPGAFQKGGKGEAISYSVSETPLGQLLVAGTERGICALLFGQAAGPLRDQLKHEFPAASIVSDDGRMAEWCKALKDYLEGAAHWPLLPVDVRGTAFQAKVWEALRDIPEGQTVTYAELAKRIGKPGAARAVGTACATNRVALVIPCHRVVPKAGGVGGYRWSPERKRYLIDLEARA
jgi:AraC family transcriptional regulator of adaptative response/methylated-DNA-[protein]-cysteine methyltransferase